MEKQKKKHAETRKGGKEKKEAAGTKRETG